VRESAVRLADLTAEAGAGYLKREVVSTMLEAYGLAVREAAVLRFELTVEQAV
jgi:hypothetical protein